MPDRVPLVSPQPGRIAGPGPGRVGLARPALAETFTATLTIDLTDITPGDGKCDALSGPLFMGDQCTLRAAVQEANALAGDDMIILPANVYPLTLTGGGADTDAINDLDFGSKGLLTITGAGPSATIIEGGPGWQDGLIDMSGSAHKAQIIGVTLQNGNEVINGFSGGAISNFGAMTLTNVIVISNTGLSAGGIANIGNLTLINSAIISNTVLHDAGGIFSNARCDMGAVEVDLSSAVYLPLVIKS